MQTSKIKRPADFIVNVSLNSNKDLQGSMEFIPSGEITGFSSFMDMMVLMQTKMDEYGLPQPTTLLRRWSEDFTPGK